ncbi:MAG: MmcQ/YjbR family DNA-binding protein [Candidatus Saccharibacteria bacterium]|nr:MmcQ/YjbR family DNA-binding protein [Candidatus Saccharibacteria bacterium]
MTHKEVEIYLLTYPGAKLTYPFGKDVAVYKVTHRGQDADDEGKMFALVAEGKDPVRISLKCDPQLAVLLREKYESVMPGNHLNKKHWNTIVLTGQVPWEEVKDLIRHSYELVAN